MEPIVPGAVFNAGPGWVSALCGALSVLTLAATAFVLGCTAAERDARLLACGRAGCAASGCVLAAAGFLGLLPRWAFAVACVAFLLALLAVALRYGQGPSLRGYLEARGDAEEPAWWPVFEHGFRRDAGSPGREQNPLQRAVTRQRPQSLDPELGRVARWSAEATEGRRP
jgi:hypothetical protein